MRWHENSLGGRLKSGELGDDRSSDISRIKSDISHINAQLEKLQSLCFASNVFWGIFVVVWFLVSLRAN